MWSGHRESKSLTEEEERKDKRYIKVRGAAAVGVMLYQIGGGRSKPGLVRRISI